MQRVKIRTVYKALDDTAAKTVALITHNLKAVEVFEDGGKVWRGELRPREEILRNQLLSMGVKFVPMFVPEIHDRRAEFRKRRMFDACVVTGEPFYQLLRIGSLVRRAKFRGPIFLEITEDEAIKPRSVTAAGVAAKQHGQEDLLTNLVYLSKTMKSPRELEFDIPSATRHAAIHVLKEERRSSATPALFRETASDLADPPRRSRTVVSRIIRDSKTARSLKSLYEHRCQVCGTRIEAGPNMFYSEVHHIRPLGAEHNGA